ncbi:unnamed protein product [Cylicocyclus nassatus]|uniref:Uncharacterized protein n=1 Tax=Cylicocyclus nassatus TaxID=53992 RepID=A0AA36DSN9_CYLNA|nr:unnamed protein product [Cylicocyclus nassatus]
MRWLVPIVCVYITAAVALTPAERRALIPTSLRKKLCERTGRSDICDFREDKNIITEEEDSKWSICKYHPEMQFCKWDPLHSPGIPQVPVDLETTTMHWKPAETPFVSKTNFDTPTVIKSPIYIKSAEKTAPTIAPMSGSSMSQEDKSRYDGKLSIERVGSAPTRTANPPEEDDFSDKIMDMKEDVFE